MRAPKSTLVMLFAIVIGLFSACIFPSMAIAQDEFEDEIIRADRDGFPIHITYFPALVDAVTGGLTNAPVVVLLHGEKESRLVWNKGSSPRGTNPFPVELQKRGYAVISVDLRKHGESLIDEQKQPVLPADYGKMVLGDMKGVKKFIQEEHQKQRLNMRKMAIIGSGKGAAVAAGFAEYDWRQKPYDDAPTPAQRTPRGQDVQVLILISPAKGAGKLLTSRSVGYLKNPSMNIALQVIIGEEDTKNLRTAKSIFNNFTTIKDNRERASLVAPKVKDFGLALLRRPATVAYIPMLAFLDKNLKTRTIPWQDRRSRLER